MQAMPNSNVNNNTGFVTSSPRLDYRVNFNKSGLHCLIIDTTIFNNHNFVSNPLSNGMGEHIFAGRTGVNNTFEIRRELLAFDIEGTLPANAIIDIAFLQLTV